MTDKITFTEYIMSCLQKEALEQCWREKHGEETTDKETGTEDSRAGEEQTTPGTPVKPVTRFNVEKF